MDLQSTSSTPLLGTPIPKNTLSDETLRLLEQAATDLGSIDLNAKSSSTKRKRTEENGDIRTNYPEATKSVYLKIKNLYKKKLSIAVNMHAIKNGLKNNKYPAATDFRGKPPPNRSEAFRLRWDRIIGSCKEKLSLLVLEDLNEKYQGTKMEIQALMAELQLHLNNTQFTEISTFLQEKYKNAMPVALSKSQKKMDKPRRTNRPPQQKRDGKQRPFKKALRRDDKMSTKKLLTALLKSL